MYIETLVDRFSIDFDGDAILVANALNLRPLANRAGHVFLAASVKFLFESRLMFRPPELLSRINRFLAALLPTRAAVFGDASFAGDRRRLRFVVGFGAANNNEIAFTSLCQLHFDAGRPNAIGVDLVQQDS